MKRPPTRVWLLAGRECLIFIGLTAHQHGSGMCRHRTAFRQAAANWIEVEGRPCATGCGWLRRSFTRWTPRIWFLWRMNFGRARGPWAALLRLCLLSCGFMHAVGSGRWPLPFSVASQALMFQIDLANQRVDPEARSFLCCCCASLTVPRRLASVC